ncbi:uncharacterized protein LOC127136859 [Lathyrus oleraceus]|uniref:uncharacterized protein LOC127136859 n=1 Tax=Pisum sativum TaxID=3888 RepID=UPI0021CFE26E|nr:uncharacterized protein LOC127136859 [Pisum sativum]
MSQTSISIPSKSSKEKSNPKSIGTEIDLFDVITDVVPLSIVHVHATPMRKARTSSSRKGKPTKVSTSSIPSITARNMNDPKPLTIVKKPMSMTILGINPKINLVLDVSTSLAQPDNNIENPKDKLDVDAPTLSPEKSQDKERSEDMTNELGNKDKNHVGQPTEIVNIEELDSDDIPIGKGQLVGSSSTPSKSVKNKTSIDPTKKWSKVVTHDIISTSRKQAPGKKIPANISEVPLDNISFHSVEKWKFVYQRRLALERELGKDAFECKEVLSLIQEAGLIKTVTSFGKCYEMLVKEFIVNISKECDNKRRREFRKVYIRERHVNFSPKIINMFLGINEEEQAKIEVSNNVICREITAKQVKEWPRKGK